jgi:hypothetical protein
MTTHPKTRDILWGGLLAGTGFLIGSYLANRRARRKRRLSSSSADEDNNKDNTEEESNAKLSTNTVTSIAITLPANTQCPKEGVFFHGKIPDCMEPKVWVFIANHCVNLEFYNKIMFDADDDVSYHKTISFPARLRAEAGFLRAWGIHDKSGTCTS